MPKPEITTDTSIGERDALIADLLFNSDLSTVQREHLLDLKRRVSNDYFKAADKILLGSLGVEVNGLNLFRTLKDVSKVKVEISGASEHEDVFRE